MSDIIAQDIQGVNVFDIAKSPEKYPEDLQRAALEVIIKKMYPMLAECRQKLQHSVKKQMEEDGASKAYFIGVEGHCKEITLKSGKMDCVVKDAKQVYSNAGFDPDEIGEDVFKPSWAKAKKAMKVGGVKKEIIEKIFKEGNKTLEISEAKE